MPRSLWQRIAIIVVLVAGCAFIARGYGRGRNAPRESFRRVEAVQRELRITKTATGEVTPQNRVEVKAPIAGRIEEVLAREGDVVTQGQILAWMSSMDRAALLDAARAQGPDELKRWQAAYKPAPLMAPLDGTVIVRAVEPGQTVTTSDPVVVVADRLIVKAQVDETDIGAIAVRQSAAISLDAFPNRSIDAHVDHVAYEAKTVNNVTIYEVDVLPDEIPDVMRSGMTATVIFTVASKADALVVPAEAIRQGRSGASLLVAGSGPWGKPTPREVTTGLSDGKWIEILSGLEPGQMVLAPSMRLSRDGAKRRGGSPFSPFGSSGDGRRPQ